MKIKKYSEYQYILKYCILNLYRVLLFIRGFSSSALKANRNSIKERKDEKFYYIHIKDYSQFILYCYNKTKTKQNK